MKTVLLRDVKPLGKVGMLVEIPEGCARNFLLPKKLSAAATAENLNTLKLKQASEAKIAVERPAEAKALAAKIEADSVTVHIKGGENGKTYGSVSTEELAEAVKEQLSLGLDKKETTLAGPIKNFGSYETVVKSHRDVQMTLKVNVTEAE